MISGELSTINRILEEYGISIEHDTIRTKEHKYKKTLCFKFSMNDFIFELHVNAKEKKIEGCAVNNEVCVREFDPTKHDFPFKD